MIMLAMVILLGSAQLAHADMVCSNLFPVWIVCEVTRDANNSSRSIVSNPFPGKGFGGTPGGTPGDGDGDGNGGTPGTPGSGKGDHNHDGHSDNGKGNRK